MNVKPLRNNIFAVIEMGQRQIGSIILRDDNGRDHGIRPRWAKVWKVSEDIDYVQPGQWILVEHGRWTMTVELPQQDGSKFKFQKIDPKGIMCVMDEQPSDVADVDLPQ